MREAGRIENHDMVEVQLELNLCENPREQLKPFRCTEVPSRQIVGLGGNGNSPLN